MRVRSTLSAVPAAVAVLLAPAVYANSVCVTIHAFPGKSAEMGASPCLGSGGVPVCRFAAVETTEEVAYVEVCAGTL